MVLGLDSVLGEDSSAPAPTKSETKSPAASWLREITRLPPGPFAKIRPVRLTFELGWKNKIHAGKITVSVHESEKDHQRLYLGEARGGTTGLARLLWPYDVQAKSVVDRESLRPRLFELQEKERNKLNSYRIRFEAKRLICDTTRTHKKRNGGLPLKSEYKFYHDFGQDILSAIFYVRSQPLKQEDQVSMVVTPFNRPYLTKFQVTGRETRKIDRKVYQTIRLNAGIGKIRNDFSVEPYSKVKKITVWITDDAYRFPLELQAEVFVGYVSARLTSREWLDSAPH